MRSAVTARSCLEGRGCDYERLETLGDAFLKYAVSAAHLCVVLVVLLC